MKKYLYVSAALVALLLCTDCLFAQRKWAVVELSAAFLRHAPDYEAGLDTQLLMGRVVEVLDQDNYWVKVRSLNPPYVAWVNELALAPMDEDQKNAYVKAQKYIFLADRTYIYSAPSATSQHICDAVRGDILLKTLNTAGKAAKKKGFLSVTLPSGRTGYVRKKDVTDFDRWAQNVTPTAEGVIAEAMRYLGAPYMWGGNTIESADCSGMTISAYFMNGLMIPRDASQQAKVGKEIPLDEIQPGDLLFFGTAASEDKPERISHVAIYLGDNKIIQASQLVRINTLEEGHPDSYTRPVLHAKRIIGYVTDKSSSVFQNN